jgi:hypothetical protein
VANLKMLDSVKGLVAFSASLLILSLVDFDQLLTSTPAFFSPFRSLVASVVRINAALPISTARH